jgi:hypothetical protein
MSESRVSFICSYSKLRDLAPLLVGEVSMLHIEPLDAPRETSRVEQKRAQGLQARDRIEAYIEENLDSPGFEISRQDLKRLLIGFGFKSPSASVSHAMTTLTKKYDLEIIGSSLWRIRARRPVLAHA